MLENEIKTLQKKVPKTYWSERILTEVNYLLKVSEQNGNKMHTEIEKVVQVLRESVDQDQVITKALTEQCEKQLAPYSEAAKSYKMICISHAHIDMNWMWGWDETVAVTLDTVRTILDLMEEYPEFTYAQSQASIYQIIEDYAPELLDEIKKRVHEGRWEVTASHWVEADKNMPNGESLSRHILYTKQYLSGLLDIDPKRLNIDFEPDTFGHSLNVPEILTNGGVKYYYHCRGYEGFNLYRWIAPSGSSVIVYREPIWYNGDIEPSMALNVPSFCSEYHNRTMLKVYGVGDHGGGPTRRDIERIKDLNTWPIFPEIVFGTYQDYFAEVEKQADLLPEVRGELNAIFTGCYTSQSRIKMANRLSEQTLDEAEKFSTIASLLESRQYPHKALSDAWKQTLFGQFHDILPGSGVTETREYAMGSFQNIMAAANSARSLALKGIASQINTSSFFDEALENLDESTSEGAGVGFGSKSFRVFQAERGRGLTRVFHVFNSAMADRKENAEVTIWDWHGDTEKIIFENESGQVVSHQLLEKGFNHYWGHHYIRLLIEAEVPALGYRTYVLKQSNKEQAFKLIDQLGPQPRVEGVDCFCLENEYIKVSFDTKNAALISFIDKKLDKEIIDSHKGTQASTLYEDGAGVFRYIEEDDNKGMTAWTVGRYMNVEPIVKNVKITKVENEPSLLRQSLEYHVSFKHSSLRVVISLDRNRKQLDFDVECNWQEHGKHGEFIPQLNYHLPLSYPVSQYKYDVPMGVIERGEKDQDAVGNSFIYAEQDRGYKMGMMLVTDSKYGFRGYNHSLSVSLIRGSYDPDPYPELGIHHFRFALCLLEETQNSELLKVSESYRHPLHVFSGKNQADVSLDPTGQFMKLVSGSVCISGVKKAEDDGKTDKFQSKNSNRYIIRLYETDGKMTSVNLKCFKPIQNAYFVDLNENTLSGKVNLEAEEQSVQFEVQPYSMAAICLEMEESF